MKEIQVVQSAMFRRAYKRLHSNQKADVDDAVAEIVRNPTIMVSTHLSPPIQVPKMNNGPAY